MKSTDEFDEKGIGAEIIINERTDGLPYDVSTILERFKEAICLKCGAKGQGDLMLTEDNVQGRQVGYMICLECGANNWDPATIDRSRVMEEGLED